MAAQQPDARAHNPNGLDFTRVASYERRIRADIERVWENVLDWEHLAHLHDTSFDFIDLIDAGSWGWRVHSNEARTATIELVVADAHSYVSRSYADGAQKAEIWTFLTPGEGATDIRVEFDLADVPEARRDAYGERMLALYGHLWDEDEAMMMARTRRLQESRSRERTVTLGRRGELRLPLTFELGGREYRLREVDGALTALPTTCPHLLGPLPEQPAADGTLTCPWHGYRFDVSTGACLWPATATCRLPPTPAIELDDDLVIARA
ncbi:MAG TPA: Rieske (2Fe-2S) protein [Pseudomonadales bacterium]|nr:Rieske (2Fe-2S) protein [Pseudomonadales bacterium]